MKTIIVYSSKSGNTGKIAASIAAQLNCEAIKVTAETNPAAIYLDSYDLILLGTGLYAGTPNQDITKFLSSINFKTQNSLLYSLLGEARPEVTK